MNVHLPEDSSKPARDAFFGRDHGSGAARPHVAEPGQEHLETIDLSRLLQAIWHRKLIIIASVFIFSLLGLVLVSQSTPYYTATARVLINSERLNVVNMEQVLVNSDANSASIQNYVEIIRATALLSKVVDTLQLDNTPEFNPALRTDRPSLLDQARRYIRDLLPQRSFFVDLGILSAPAETVASARTVADETAVIVQQLRNGLSVGILPNSRVVVVKYTSTNPRLAARIANGVANQFIDEEIGAQRQAARSASHWLQEQAEDLQLRVRDAEGAVEMMRAELTQAAGQGAQVTTQQLQVLVGALAPARAKRSSLEIRLEGLTNAIQSDRDLGAIPELRASSVMQEYRQRLNALRDQEVALRTVRSSDLPELRTLEARMADVISEMQLESHRIVDGIALELHAAKEEERTLLEQIRELEQKALDHAREELRLRELEREAESRRRLYENIVSRLSEINLQETLQAPGPRLLSPAEVTSTSGARSGLQTVTLASMGGIIFGLGMIFVLEQLSKTFRSFADVETATGFVVLAGIPQAGRRKKPRQLLAAMLSRSVSPLAESIRNLRTSILFSNIDQPPKVIMFTSSLPMEGKTTTAMLTAIASQQMERSAIIVDCDLRRRTMGSMLRLGPDQPGLFAALQGICSLDEAVYVEPETGLHVLASERAGQGFGNPADILASRSFQRLIGQLKARYDLVILDTPPTLVVTDSRVLAQLADAVVYLVRWNHTRRAATIEGMRELLSVRAKIAGVVLTGVDPKQTGGYAGSEYSYKHGSYAAS